MNELIERIKKNAIVGKIGFGALVVGAMIGIAVLTSLVLWWLIA